jgi:4-oxalocrotonate tautomerase
MPIIHIHIISGRSLDQKRMLVSKVTSAVTETIGTAEESVHIVLHESEAENVSKGGVLRADLREGATS